MMEPKMLSMCITPLSVRTFPWYPIPKVLAIEQFIRSDILKNIRFDDLAGGLLREQFTKAFNQVMENMADVNTPYKNARGINIKLKFVQNEKRDDVVMTATVETKLASQAPTGTSFAVGRDLRTGKMYVEEYGKNLAGQYSMDDLTIDEETGEVLEDHSAEVLVFPKAAQA